MGNISEIVENIKDNNFTGRDDILKKINDSFNNTSNIKPIVNLYGAGGMGKTSILDYTKNTWYPEGIPNAIIDFKKGNIDVFDIIQSLKGGLSSNSELSTNAFNNYNKVEAKIDKNTEKLLNQIKKGKDTGLLKDYLSAIATTTTKEIGKDAGKTIGKAAESIVPALGGGIGTAIGGFAGAIVGTVSGVIVSKFIEHTKQEGTVTLSKIGLSKQEINTFVHYKDNLTKAFIEGLNELSDISTHVILGFDTFEKVPTEIEQWLVDNFIPKLNDKILIFFCGREKLTNNVLWRNFSGIINSFEIDKFSDEESKQYLIKRQITDENIINRMINATHGLPWALALFADEMQEQTEIDVENINEDAIGGYVVDRFLDHISDIHLKNAILFCSVTNYFDFQVLSGFFSGLNNESKENLFKQICQFSFTRHIGKQQFCIHDVVSSFLVKKIKTYSINDYAKYNQYMSQYFSSKVFDNIIDKAKSHWESIFYSLNYDESNALDKIDSILCDSAIISLDITKEYLYKGIIDYPFQSSRGMLYNNYADAYLKTINGEWNDAENLLNNILTNSSQLVSDSLKDCVSARLSDIYLGQGKYLEVKTILEEVATRNSQSVETKKMKMINAKLCEIYAILGLYTQGEKLAIQNKNNCTENLECAWACKSLGDIYRLWGKPQKAISSLQEGLKIFIDEKENYGEAIMRTQLARNYIQIGKWDDAEIELKKAETIYKKYDNKYGLANCILFSGNIKRLKFRWKEAKIDYLNAYELHNTMNSYREIAPLYGSLGLVCYHLGNQEEANTSFEKSIKMKKEQGYDRGVMITLIYRGDCCLEEENIDGALSYYEEAMNMLKEPFPIYVQAELELKFFICNLIKNGVKNFDNDKYNSIKANISSNEYYNLLTILEFKALQIRLSFLTEEQSVEIINNCLSAAKNYNDFYYNRYYAMIIENLESVYDNEIVIRIKDKIC